MPKTTTKIEAEDGRRARGTENRRKIVEAMLALIGEGTISPSAEDVAARAEVGLRTVFRHFDDMDSLYHEISSAMTAELMPIAQAPFPDGDWRVKLTDLIERRAKVFEKMMPYKIAADVHKHRSHFLREEHAGLGELQRKTLRSVLGPNLARDKVRFEALDLLLNFDSWRHMRREQALSIAQAKAIMKRVVEALFIEEGK